MYLETKCSGLVDNLNKLNMAKLAFFWRRAFFLHIFGTQLKLKIKCLRKNVETIPLPYKRLEGCHGGRKGEGVDEKGVG
jgi:hypothetical protein